MYKLVFLVFLCTNKSPTYTHAIQEILKYTNQSHIVANLLKHPARLTTTHDDHLLYRIGRLLYQELAIGRIPTRREERYGHGGLESTMGA